MIRGRGEPSGSTSGKAEGEGFLEGCGQEGGLVERLGRRVGSGRDQLAVDRQQDPAGKGKILRVVLPGVLCASGQLDK